MKKFPLILLIIIVLILAALYLSLVKNKPPEKNNLSSFEIKPANFLDSTPLHNEIYAAQPVNVTLNFNLDLTQNSILSVKSTDDIEWSEDELLIEDANTALKKKLKQSIPDGDYYVTYTACFVNNTCSDGQFKFKIDSAKKSEYQDLRGKTEVEVKMEALKFSPNKIIVSPKTLVVWQNSEDAGHFVNTETHPEHTYYPEQNSREILKDQKFSLTFSTLGQYNYHCSAHIPEGMLGSIIVSD